VEFTPKGCAVKLQYRTGGPTTLLYAYPPDMQGNALPEIRPYFERLAKRGENVALMRERLMRVAPFQASGQYTLRLPISEDGLDTAEAAMREFLCIVRELAQRYSSLRRNFRRCDAQAEQPVSGLGDAPPWSQLLAARAGTASRCSVLIGAPLRSSFTIGPSSSSGGRGGVSPWSSRVRLPRARRAEKPWPRLSPHPAS